MSNFRSMPRSGFRSNKLGPHFGASGIEHENEEYSVRSTLEKLEIQLQKQEALNTHFSNQIQSNNELIHSSIREFQSSLQMIFQELKDLKQSKDSINHPAQEINNSADVLVSVHNMIYPITEKSTIRPYAVEKKVRKAGVHQTPNLCEKTKELEHNISLYKKVNTADPDQDLLEKSLRKWWSSTKVSSLLNLTIPLKLFAPTGRATIRNICHGHRNKNCADKLYDVMFEKHKCAIFHFVLVRNGKMFIDKFIFIFDPGGTAFNMEAVKILQELFLEPGRLQFIYTDLGDAKAVNGIFAENAFDAVMHFSVVAYVGESTLEPLRYYHNTTSNTLTVLQTMAARNVKTLIYSSTRATYGEPDKMPITEKTPQFLINPYGKAKKMSKDIILDYS